jgi:hypothetical protein
MSDFSRLFWKKTTNNWDDFPRGNISFLSVCEVGVFGVDWNQIGGIFADKILKVRVAMRKNSYRSMFFQTSVRLSLFPIVPC